jgi:hypothetical protein
LLLLRHVWLHAAQFDARQRRQGLQSGLKAAPPWWARPRRPMRRLTAAEVALMTQGNDAEALRARKAKLKALKISKQKRALEVKKLIWAENTRLAPVFDS